MSRYVINISPPIKYNINLSTQDKYNIILKSSTGPKGDRGEKGDPGEDGLDSVTENDVLNIIRDTVIDGGNF